MLELHQKRPPRRQAALAAYMGANEDVRGSKSLALTSPSPRMAVRSTPRTAGSYANNSVRLDTEGRFTSIESPAPPPGPSPSLLKATPGRTVFNASSWYGTGSVERQQAGPSKAANQDAALNDIQDIQDFSDGAYPDPLPPPRFETQNRHAPYRKGEQQAVRLEKWFLTFMPTSKAGNIDPSIRHLSHWIIVTGTRAKNASAHSSMVSSGSSRDVSPEDDTEQWHSSLITERVSQSLVRTGSGKVYELVGSAYTRVMCERKGFSRGVALAFTEGFPKNWVAILASEAVRRGLVGAGENTSITSEVFSAVQGRAYKSDAGFISGSESIGSKIKPDLRRRPVNSLREPLSQTPLSGKRQDDAKIPSLTTRPEAKLTTSTSSKSKKARPKGVPRELLNLSKTGFGRLAVVECAMLEELDRNTGSSSMDTTTRRGGRRSLPAKLEEPVAVVPATPLAPRKSAAEAPSTRRSSERKQVSAKRWWEVAQSLEATMAEPKAETAKAAQAASVSQARKRAARQSAPASYFEEAREDLSPVKAPESSSDDDVFRADLHQSEDEDSDQSDNERSKSKQKRKRAVSKRSATSRQTGSTHQKGTKQIAAQLTKNEPSSTLPAVSLNSRTNVAPEAVVGKRYTVAGHQGAKGSVTSAQTQGHRKKRQHLSSDADFELLAAIPHDEDEDDDDMIPTDPRILQTNMQAVYDEESTDEDRSEDEHELYSFSD